LPALRFRQKWDSRQYLFALALVLNVSGKYLISFSTSLLYCRF
jgi:hypothetical protein